jgi:hypothetical protein
VDVKPDPHPMRRKGYLRTEGCRRIFRSKRVRVNGAWWKLHQRE